MWLLLVAIMAPSRSAAIHSYVPQLLIYAACSPRLKKDLGFACTLFRIFCCFCSCSCTLFPIFRCFHSCSCTRCFLFSSNFHGSLRSILFPYTFLLRLWIVSDLLICAISLYYNGGREWFSIVPSLPAPPEHWIVVFIIRDFAFWVNSF